MVGARRRPAGGNAPVPQAYSPRRQVDSVQAVEDSRSQVRPACLAEITELLEETSEAVGAALAQPVVVRDVLTHDPDSVWVFERDGHPVGGAAFLFLSETGVAALLAGSIDPHAPDKRWLVRPDESPAGIYIWALLGRGRAAFVLSHGFARLRETRYAPADLWTTPSSAAGRRFTRMNGFQEVAERPGLYRYIRGGRA